MSSTIVILKKKINCGYNKYLLEITFLKGVTESLDPKCRLSRVLKTEEKLDELYGTSAKSSEASSSDTTTIKQGKITNSELKRGKFGYS